MTVLIDGIHDTDAFRRSLNNRIEEKSSFNKEKIEVVSKFKLLGITLDYRLNLLDFVSGLSLVINRKMFAIKR